MTHHIGNLNPSERTISGVLGVALSAVGLLGRGSLLRVAGVTAGALLLARAVGGHCGVKAALTGKSSLRTGMKDQWQAMRHSVQRTAAQLRRDRRSEPEPTEEAVDESVELTFPASDPPASLLPDVPPSNAAAKWEAARNAGLVT